MISIGFSKPDKIFKWHTSVAHFGNLSLRCLAKWGFVVIWDLGPQLLASQEKHLNMCRDILVKIYDIKHKLFPFMYSLLTFCYTFWLFHDVRKFCVFFLEKEENNFGKCGTSQMTIDHKVYCKSTQITSHFFEIASCMSTWMKKVPFIILI